MKKIFTQIKLLSLAILLGLGASYAYALTNDWSGPNGSAPGAGKPVVISATAESQSKGNTGLPQPGAILDIQGAVAGANVAVWNNASVGNVTPPVGDFYINSLDGNTQVCVDSNHKLNTECTGVGGGGGGGPTGNITFTAGVAEYQFDNTTFDGVQVSNIPSWPIVHPTRITGTYPGNKTSTIRIYLSSNGGDQAHLFLSNSSNGATYCENLPMTRFTGLAKELPPVQVTTADITVSIISGTCIR